ncbi:MAG: CcdB family protein [Pseudomonadota bacterium]
MSAEPYAIVTLQNQPDRRFAVLSYPGLDATGAIVIAPLLKKGDIAIVDVLHPVVEIDGENRVLAVERLAGVPPSLIAASAGSLLAYEYPIQRALARLFFGN